MIRRPPRATQSRSSAASDVYKRQGLAAIASPSFCASSGDTQTGGMPLAMQLSLIHISEPTRLGMISYAVFCLKKKKNTTQTKYHKNPLQKKKKTKTVAQANN